MLCKRGMKVIQWINKILWFVRSAIKNSSLDYDCIITLHFIMNADTSEKLKK